MAFNDVYDEDTLKEFQEAFRMFDIDASGDIDVGELGAVFAQLGQNISEAELEDLIKEVDDDGSGQIEFDEFLTLMGMKTNQTEQDFMEAFKALDRDQTQTIDARNLVIAFSSLGEEKKMD